MDLMSPGGGGPITPHPMHSAAQMLGSLQSDSGASFGKQSPDMAVHVAPASASNYGTARLTAWGTHGLNATPGHVAPLSTLNRASFVNWGGDSGGTTTPAAAGAQQQYAYAQ